MSTAFTDLTDAHTHLNELHSELKTLRMSSDPSAYERVMKELWLHYEGLEAKEVSLMDRLRDLHAVAREISPAELPFPENCKPPDTSS